MTEYLSVKELGKLLNLSTATIYRMIYERQIPFSRIGGQYRFHLQTIKDWVQKTGQPKE